MRGWGSDQRGVPCYAPGSAMCELRGVRMDREGDQVRMHANVVILQLGKVKVKCSPRGNSIVGLAARGEMRGIAVD